MKKIRVWEQANVGDFAGCPGIYLRLVGKSSGVHIVACNNQGVIVEGGYLLEILNSGIVAFQSAVTNDLHFPLDSYGRLKVGYVQPELAEDVDYRYRQEYEALEALNPNRWADLVASPETVEATPEVESIDDFDESYDPIEDDE